MDIFKFWRFIILILILAGFLIHPSRVFADNSSFISVINPVRGMDFNEIEQSPAVAVKGQAEILRQFNIPATWLVRFDAFADPEILKTVQSLPTSHEVGLFLEITPSWTQSAGVGYRKSPVWHMAGSVFLTGYTTSEREKLIDQVFTKYKQIFGFYPKSVGAWYIDSYSLGYMQDRYKITAALIVADQYTTDNYQIWGQYWSAPYYPSKKHTLIPAQTVESKLPVVVMQWASRDPINGYGDGVQESTYSLQANDYLDYHDLGSNYFSKLVDIYTQQNLTPFNFLVVGLENSYSWQKYREEYRKQIKILTQKQQSGQLTLTTMGDFASWYQSKFPKSSPDHIIVADDPLGSDKKTVWFMNPYYRAGWFFNREGSVFRDIRQYTDGQVEPCYDNPCEKLNFATSATRVLDDVTYGQKLVVDQGRIKNFTIKKEADSFLLTYLNEAGSGRKVTFMSRDIAIDNRINTIDGIIMSGIQAGERPEKIVFPKLLNDSCQESIFSFGFKIFRFVLFVLIGLFVPGYLLVRRLKQDSLILNIFLSICAGTIFLALISFVTGYLKVSWLIFICLAAALVLFIYKRYDREFFLNRGVWQVKKQALAAGLLIIAGTFFQSLGMIRSGWVYNFGMGFWGPTGHDGIWHQALVNQLIKQVPPQNPILAGEILSNYHYFYDLLVAVTYQLSFIPVLDLIYRFYPVLFSLLLGLGSYLLAKKLLNHQKAALISLYFVYFAGSFGWIVDYLKEKHFGGESAFWVNQPISMNLNPPFAISLILIIALMMVFQLFIQRKNLWGAILLILLAGSLIEFKVYAGVIALGGLLLVSLQQLFLSRDLSCLKVFLGSFLVSLGVFLPQNIRSGELLIFSPFWFIHSMIDFSDRVGWMRLSQARPAYIERGEWLKFILIETLGLAIFIIGNLGTRFIGLFTLVTFIKKKLWLRLDYSLIFWMAVISFTVPLLFIQKGNSWNTIQFFYYFLYFVAIVSGGALIYLYQKLPQPVRLLAVIIILLMTPINAMTTFQSYVSANSPARLTRGEWEGLGYLKNLPDGVVLTYPFDKKLQTKFDAPYPLPTYETTAYVSAFSNKATFIEDEIQQEILQTNYRKRVVTAKDFFSYGNPKIFQENRIRYIYLLKFLNIHIESDRLGIKKIYENQEVLIYQVNS